MKKLLIVEDEIALLRVLASQFDKKEFKVLEAEDGKEALKVALDEHPDLILLDLVMPVMDGMTMLGKLRQDKWGKDAKVIILTNLDDDAKVAEALKRGTFDYLIKSDWHVNNVVQKVKVKLGME